MGAKAKHDLAPIVRAAFCRALEIQEQKGKTFSMLMADAIDEHGILAVLDRLSKYTVREAAISGKVEHEHNHTHVAISEINSFIEQFTGSKTDSDTEAPLPH